MIEIIEMCERFEPVGSRITCNPPPTDTDEDFLCLVSADKFNEFFNLICQDYELGGSVPFNEKDICSDECFSSFTKGTTNIIATASQVFFDKFMIATNEAKRLNLLEKADRISLFQSILYGNEVTNV